jgi:oxaloacetate decarboxylase gamma subunit
MAAALLYDAPRAGDSGMLWSQGLELLVYGMGTVVLFLSLLVFATRGMSAAVARWFPEPERHPGPRSAPGSAAPSPEVVAAISLAIHQHRQGRERS